MPDAIASGWAWRLPHGRHRRQRELTVTAHTQAAVNESAGAPAHSEDRTGTALGQHGIFWVLLRREGRDSPQGRFPRVQLIPTTDAKHGQPSLLQW